MEIWITLRVTHILRQNGGEFRRFECAVVCPASGADGGPALAVQADGDPVLIHSAVRAADVGLILVPSDVRGILELKRDVALLGWCARWKRCCRPR